MQNRSSLDYIAQAVRSYRTAQPCPSLLKNTSTT
jgi:hypothetical protein